MKVHNPFKHPEVAIGFIDSFEAIGYARYPRNE